MCFNNCIAFVWSYANAQAQKENARLQERRERSTSRYYEYDSIQCRVLKSSIEKKSKGFCAKIRAFFVRKKKTNNKENVPSYQEKRAKRRNKVSPASDQRPPYQQTGPQTGPSYVSRAQPVSRRTGSIKQQSAYPSFNSMYRDTQLLPRVQPVNKNPVPVKQRPEDLPRHPKKSGSSNYHRAKDLPPQVKKNCSSNCHRAKDLPPQVKKSVSSKRRLPPLVKKTGLSKRCNVSHLIQPGVSINCDKPRGMPLQPSSNDDCYKAPHNLPLLTKRKYSRPLPPLPQVQVQ